MICQNFNSKQPGAWLMLPVAATNMSKSSSEREQSMRLCSCYTHLTLKWLSRLFGVSVIWQAMGQRSVIWSSVPMLSNPSLTCLTDPLLAALSQGMQVGLYRICAEVDPHPNTRKSRGVFHHSLKCSSKMIPKKLFLTFAGLSPTSAMAA